MKESYFKHADRSFVINLHFHAQIFINIEFVHCSFNIILITQVFNNYLRILLEVLL